MALFEIKNLTFTYAGSRFPALKDVSLTLEEGGFYVICGRSGSGKSTLLSLMKREPSGNLSGSILYDGTELHKLDERRRVAELGFVHQDVDAGLVCDKVWKELSFGLGNLGYSDEFIGCRVAEVSEYFGISDLYTQKISELSGGCRQIVALAAVMTLNPKVLLLDEPMSMLDPVAKRNFANLLCRINQELGVTIVVVEHNLDCLFDAAQHFIVMDGGSVAVTGDRKDICAEISGKSCAQYVGLPEFAEVFTRLGGRGDLPDTFGDKRDWLCTVLPKGIARQNLTQNGEPPKSKTHNVVLSADKLYFRYDKHGRDIIKGASLQLLKGETLCLLGGNGGGKTTFAGLLTGAKKAYSGKVKRDKSLRIAMLCQRAKDLFAESSVRDELLVTAKLLGIGEGKAKQLMTDFELDGIADRHVYDISGGEVQRLALAKLFLLSPDIIILDEPTQGMDIAAKRYLIDLIAEQKGKGKSFLCITHDMQFAAAIADRVGMFFDGKVLALDAADKFFANNSVYTSESSLLTRGTQSGLYTPQKIVDFVQSGKS